MRRLASPLDEITGGGLPRGRTTLLMGGPGAGKTILALQFLVHGARHCREPGIFVAFEETSKRIAGNASSFGWKLDELQRKRLFFFDVQPTPDLIQAGNSTNGFAALDSSGVEGWKRSVRRETCPGECPTCRAAARVYRLLKAAASG